MPLQGVTVPTRNTQGVASLALGWVLHWAFSPHLLNPKVKYLICLPPYLLKLQFCLHSTLLRHNTLNIIRFTSVYTLALCLHCHIHSCTHAHYLHNVPTRDICHGRAIKRLCESGRAVRWTEISVWHYRKICPRLPLCTFVCHSICHA